ncbi:Endonuclease/exonuclease/phosphatase [Sesbania bispinosa]|nr:Endonuclease/exonuclease/phosphatase [Sesbania bispinosa]
MSDEEQQQDLIVELETEELQSFQLARKSLIGKIFADKPLNKGAVRSIVFKAWGESKEIHVTDMGVNLFLLLLRIGRRVSFWVQLHGFPLDMLNTKNAAKIVNRFGEVQEVENPELEGRLLRTFISVRAMINITKPLITGHEQKDCSKEKVMSSRDQNTPKYSAKLGVAPAKSIISMAQEQGFWKHRGPSNKNGDSGNTAKEWKKKGTENSNGNKQGTTKHLCISERVLQSNMGNKSADMSEVMAQHQKGKFVAEPNSSLKVNDERMPSNKFPLSYLSFEMQRTVHAGASKGDQERPHMSPSNAPPCSNVATVPQTHRKFMSKKGGTEKEDSNLGYFVEFPSDDDEANQNRSTMKLQQDEESQLILGWNNSLSLKRRIFQGWGGRPQTAPPAVMSWICWNCRGLAAASTIRELKGLCSKYKSSLVFLSETRAVGQKIERFRRQLRFDHCFWVNPIGLSGGLCIFWKRPLIISVSSHSQNYIHATVEDSMEERIWETTFLYRNPNFQQRRYLWSRIQALRPTPNQPWTIMGDFNELLYHHEKDGLRPIEPQRMEFFRDFVSNLGLMDLDFKGCKFTWYSNPRNGFVTREKLDRILVNWEWRSLFPNALAMAIPSVSSDHTPIIFWLKPKLRSAAKFKFEAFWEEHEDCKAVIDEGWVDRMGEAQGWDKFLNKAETCRASLKNWHRQTFKRADLQILQLSEELQLLLNSNTLDFSNQCGRIQDLREQIDRLRKQETIYWAQRSRVKWLQYSDRNSKFFHASTTQRRDRNKLYRLKGLDGNWVEGQSGIENLVLGHYGEVYKSGSTSDIDQCLLNFPKKECPKTRRGLFWSCCECRSGTIQGDIWVSQLNGGSQELTA